MFHKHSSLCFQHQTVSSQRRDKLLSKFQLFKGGKSQNQFNENLHHLQEWKTMPILPWKNKELHNKFLFATLEDVQIRSRYLKIKPTLKKIRLFFWPLTFYLGAKVKSTFKILLPSQRKKKLPQKKTQRKTGHSSSWNFMTRSLLLPQTFR